MHLFRDFLGPLAKLKLGVNLNNVGEYGSEAHAGWEIIDL